MLGAMELILIGDLAPPPDEGGYVGWSDGFNLIGSNGLMTADADGSGFNNLYEYAFGGNPTNPADNGQNPSHMLKSDQIEYTYLRRIDPELNYTVQVGTNLLSGAWSTNGVTEMGQDPVSAHYEMVTNLVETALRENGFIRVRVNAQD